MAGIELRSTAFKHNDVIPRRYSRDGENVNPELEWSGVPDGAAELVLLCEDPDAPRRSFLHWLVTGIDPGCSGAGTGTTPDDGTTWRNGFGQAGWAGPQPPVGDKPHRYLFHLFAVSEPIKLPDEPTADDVHDAVRDHLLARGTLIGIYAR